MTEQVECNCAWNPDRHADTCPVYMQQQIETLQQQVEAMRGLVPDMPPRPPEGEGLPRYGLRWSGPSQPLSVPMDDGYWTPWHLAERLQAELKEARTENEEWYALRNRQSDLLSETAIALRGPEPALTRYSHADIPSRVKAVVGELEAAREMIQRLTTAGSLEAYGSALHDAREMLSATRAQRALAPENQRVVPVEPLLAPRHPFDRPSVLKHCNVEYSAGAQLPSILQQRKELLAQIEAAATDQIVRDKLMAMGWTLLGEAERQEPVAIVKKNAHCPEGKSDEISEYLPVGTRLYAIPQIDNGTRLVHVPALDEHLRYILGRPNFWCYHLANALRAMGQEIARKAEEEQAAVIHWLLNAYFEHGPGWREAVEKILAAEREKELARGGEK